MTDIAKKWTFKRITTYRNKMTKLTVSRLLMGSTTIQRGASFAADDVLMLERRFRFGVGNRDDFSTSLKGDRSCKKQIENKNYKTE
jgi:hypothetical protein